MPENALETIRGLLERAKELERLAPETARASAQEALALAREVGELRLSAEANSQLGRLALGEGDLEAALFYLYSAVGGLEVSAASERLAEAWAAVARALERGADWSGAIEAWTRAGDLAAERGQISEARTARLGTARCQLAGGLPEAAFATAQAELERAETGGKPAEQARLLTLSGAAARESGFTGALLRSEQDLARAIQLVSSPRHTKIAIDAEVELAHTLADQGRFEDSLRAAKTARDRAKALGDEELFAQCGLRVCESELGAGRGVEAKLAALEALEATNSAGTRARALSLIASADERLGAFPAGCDRWRLAYEARLEADALAIALLRTAISARMEFELGRMAAETDRIRSVELVEAGRALHESLEENRKLERRLHALSTLDELTGATNRRHFLLQGEREVSRARRYGKPFALVLAEVDSFEAMRKAHGEAAGDEVLVRIARTGQRSLRSIDLIGRIGSSSFAMLLVAAEGGDALKTGERVRQAIAGEEFASPSGSFRVTVSVGMAELAEGDAGLTSVLRRAQGALARARDSGGNRVIAF